MCMDTISTLQYFGSLHYFYIVYKSKQYSLYLRKIHNNWTNFQIQSQILLYPIRNRISRFSLWKKNHTPPPLKINMFFIKQNSALFGNFIYDNHWLAGILINVCFWNKQIKEFIEHLTFKTNLRPNCIINFGNFATFAMLIFYGNKPQSTI